MGYLIGIIGLLIIIILDLFIFDKDIISPSLITAFLFIMEVFTAWYAEKNWNNTGVSNDAIYIVLVGCLGFFCGELVIRRKRRDVKKDRYTPLILTTQEICFYSLLMLFITMILISEMRKNIGSVGGLTDLISNYRLEILYEGNIQKRISRLVTFLYYIEDILTIIFIYFFSGTLADSKKIKGICIIPIIIGVSSSMLIAGRSGLVKYFVIGLYSFFVRKKVNCEKIKMKSIVKAILLIVAMMPVLYYSLELVGRAAKVDFADYITYFIANPLTSLSQFIASVRLSDNQSFIFQKLNRVLNLMGADYNTNIPVYWFRSSLRGLSSNAYTAFAFYYIESGIWGTFIIEFLYGIFMNLLYMGAVNRKSLYFELLFYISCSCIVDQYRTERFITYFFTKDFLMYLFILYFLVKILSCKKIRFIKGRI